MISTIVYLLALTWLCITAASPLVLSTDSSPYVHKRGIRAFTSPRNLLQKRFQTLTGEDDEIEGPFYRLYNDPYGASAGSGSQSTVALFLSGDNTILGWQ